MLSVDITCARGDFSLEARFEAGPGIAVIAGPSGSGKSTLAAAVAGLVTPDNGAITLNDQPVYDHGRNINMPAAQRRVGYVQQDALLFPHMSVRRNLLYGYREGPHTLDEIAALLDLHALLDRKPAALSGGEQQRVALGRALLSQPACLVLDEPLAHLDRARRDRLMGFLEDLRRKHHLPIIYVSHNWPEIIRLADTLILMENGQVTKTGSLADVLAHARPSPLIPDGTVIDATVTSVQGTLARMDTDGGSLFALLPGTQPGATARLFIDARDVALALSRQEDISIQNILTGTIAEITALDDAHMDVTVDLGAGQHLRAQITARARESLGLTPGMTVFALVKSVALDRDLPWSEDI